MVFFIINMLFGAHKFIFQNRNKWWHIYDKEPKTFFFLRKVLTKQSEWGKLVNEFE